jgi:replication factor C large subunit
MWTDSYRPVTIQDMVGNEETRSYVVKWLLKWVNGTKPLIMAGPPGVGKTTIVQAMSRQFGYDLIEMNASDTRNRGMLIETILPILKNKSLMAEKTLLFLDEIDGISGRQDIGGIESLVLLIKEPTVPIIMAANSRDSKLKPLSRLCKVVEFDRIHPSLLLLYLDYVLKQEGKSVQFKDKLTIVRNAKGDIRAMLNMAQSWIAGYAFARDTTFRTDIDLAITKFFTAPTVEAAREILMNIEGGYPDPRFTQTPEERRKDILSAFFSSIVSAKLGAKEITNALNILSNCDLVIGRVSERRHWGLLKYLQNMISYGLFYEIREKDLTYNQYSYPWQISAPVLARRQALKELINNLAARTHTSVSVFGSTYLPYLLTMLLLHRVDILLFVQGLGLDVKAADALSKEISNLKRNFPELPGT